MYISKMNLKNFKCFPGETSLNFCNGINYFVGNNNCGKTTMFEAVEFLQSGKEKGEWITKGKEDEDVSVELVFQGDDLKDLVATQSLKKYNSYLINENQIKVKRSSEVTKWKDSKGKEKELTIKNISIFNPETENYENPTGVDKMILALYDAQFVYSDLNNGEFQDFGKTKIIGKLIGRITKEFQNSEAWTKLQIAHEEAFGNQGLEATLEDVEAKIESVMADQYGDTKVKFDFGIPTIDNFLKVGNVFLEDNGLSTIVSEKGTGMQRALALSLIQVYSQIMNEKEEVSKPFLFFLDEPETFLHPQAQDRLLQSLKKLSKKSQIFITTHSPYLLRNFDNKVDTLKIFSRDKSLPRITEDIELNLFPYSPSWGEINYFAFKVVSEEFHNELFGFLHTKVASLNKSFNGGDNTVSKNSIKSFDSWLSEQSGKILVDDRHTNNYKNYTDKTMTSYIRNYIDHPGESNNTEINRDKPKTSEIRDSIDFMLRINENLA